MGRKRYRIRVEGILGSEWADWFDCLTIEPQPDGETLLITSTVDQAYLRGVLNRLWDRNLTLISLAGAEGADPVSGPARR